MKTSPLFWVLLAGFACMIGFNWGKSSRNDAEAQNLIMLHAQYPNAARIIRAKDDDHYFVIDSFFKIKELVVDNDGKIKEEIKSEF